MARLTTTLNLCAALALAACGGGGGSGDEAEGGRPDDTPTRANLVKGVLPYNVPANDAIIGVQANIVGAPGVENLELREVHGAFFGNEIELDDSVVVFVGDSNSADFSKRPFVVSGVDDALEFRTFGYTDSSYDADFMTGSDGQSVVYLGVTARQVSAPPPSNGRVTYRGEARGDLTITGGETYSYADGSSIVEANFLTGRVNVTLNDFTTSLGAPVDEIRANNMLISGDRFDGGSVQLFGSDSAPLGSGVTTASSGFFSGGSGAGNIPNEAGGMIYAKGQRGAVVMGYVGKDPQ